MRNRVLLVLMAGVLLAAGTTPRAEPPQQPARKLLDKSTFFQMESIASPIISPDGATIVFSRGYVDINAHYRS